jgi:hypothetical protein
MRGGPACGTLCGSMHDTHPPIPPLPAEPLPLPHDALLADLVEVVSVLIASQATTARALAELAQQLAALQEEVTRLSALAEAGEVALA